MKEPTDIVRPEIKRVLVHELLTPLAGLTGILDLLETDLDDKSQEEIRDYLRDLRSCSDRLTRHVHNALSCLRIEQIQPTDPNPMREESHCFRLEDEVRKVAAKVSQCYYRSRDLRLNLQPIEVRCNRGYAVKAFYEVIDNAFKFSASDSLVKVELAEFRGVARLIVSDAGIGIGIDEIGSVGEFVQFDRARREQQGLGLGLFLARNLAMLCGGRMGISSVPGRGTLVAFELPLAYEAKA